jgi:hypothetical protein
MLILGPVLFLITAISALSQPAIITKVYITTHISILPNKSHCDPKCNIANNYLSGVSTPNPSIQNIWALTSPRKSETSYPGFGAR